MFGFYWLGWGAVGGWGPCRASVHPLLGVCSGQPYPIARSSRPVFGNRTPCRPIHVQTGAGQDCRGPETPLRDELPATTARISALPAAESGDRHHRHLRHPGPARYDPLWVRGLWPLAVTRPPLYLVVRSTSLYKGTVLP